MKIGVIGAGRIGGNAAKLFAAAGHDVLLSFSHDPVRLREKAAALGEYRPTEARQVVEALRDGHPLPPPPDYRREGNAR
ncbi:NAD(P)-binding domain-containing protein [Actinoallomurus spadix]|uniref:Pyrroline-5-carboxylate reductase catalytic N-terminal domain-containing protein n=1 Tax=Actinoallomurus spadix TaxID=79912 RepID=A0ABN0XHH1_9ACTN|nr:NAD(P)-binding domain-containing protein [Actinoallomurus spadix]MCO5987643.1 NAD(P)-binding domain-containing protein [Actinoallomurus spadix]